MQVRGLDTAVVVLATALLAPLPVAAQNATYKAPRTSDGKPDISGTFNFATITPLQRPEALAGKEKLSEQEAAEFEASENKRLNRDLFDPIKGAPSAGYAPRAQGGVLSYNEFWYERGSALTSDKRTSLITDPLDGRVPINDETRKRNAEQGRKLGAGFADSYTDRSLADRCIMGFNAGPPMVSGAYNNNMQIFQAPGYVAILNEMVHNARIIPTDGRPHGNIRQWSGDSRGRWEGETLVVETINFKQETSLTGSSANTKVIERFTRINPNTVVYAFRVEDPTTYTRPWSAAMPLNKTDEWLFEYACHEGNYGLFNIMAGARQKERAESATPTK